MSAAVAASVVIATYRRPELVRRLLDALSRQAGAPFHVVVVEQGERLVQPELYESGRPFSLDYVYLPEPGLPHARNVGLQHARGEWVLFIDDDAIPATDWVAQHVCHADDAQIGGVGGRVLEPVPAGGSAPARRKRHRTGSIRIWDAYPFAGFDAEDACDVQHVMGCNMSFRRSCLLAVGGFDERFIGTAEFEELDLCLSVRRLGYRLLFHPPAIVRHLRAPGGGCRLDSALAAYASLYHNHYLLVLKHFPCWMHPMFLLAALGRMSWRALTQRQPAYLMAGLRGLVQAVGSARRPRPSPWAASHA